MQKAIETLFSLQLIAIIFNFFALGVSLLYFTLVITFVQLAVFNLIEVLQSSFWNVIHIFLLLVATRPSVLIRKEVRSKTVL